MMFDSIFVGPHKETIGAVVKSAPPQVTLPALLQYGPKVLESAMTNNNTRIAGNLTPSFQGKTKLRFLSKGYTTIGGTKAATFLSRFEVGSPANAILVRHVLVLRRGWIYTFSCTASSDTFWKLAPQFNRTLSTIRWTK